MVLEDAVIIDLVLWYLPLPVSGPPRTSRKEPCLEPGSWELWQRESRVPAEKVGKMPVQGWRTHAEG